MADVTYSELEGLTYSELEELAYSLESTGSGGSGSTGGSESTGTGCLWTEERISAIEAKLADISSRISTLATASGVWSYGSRTLTSSQSIDTSTLAKTADLTALAAGRTLADLATPADVPTASQNASSVWSAGTRTLTSSQSIDTSTLAKTADLTALAAGRTLADLATPADVPTAAQNANSVWSAGTRTLTAAGSSGLATASSLSKLKAVADETNDSVNALKNDITQALGLIANWTLSGSTLTAYDGDGAVLGTWTVTKSAEGSIIGVTPQ